MRPVYLLDTGPLVALLVDADDCHDRAFRAMHDRDLDLVTCWPVLTEAAYLLQKHQLNPQLVIEFCEKVDLHIEPLTADDFRPICDLLETYDDLHLQLADACLLHLADRLSLDHVLTFDRRDFVAARTPRGRSLTILPDESA